MCVSSPDCLFVARGGALFTESSSLFLIWRSQWLQAKEPVGPVAVGMAHGFGGTVAVSVACGVWWDNPRLLAWSMALVGPVADRVARGHRWDPLWLTAQPTVVGVAHGRRWDLWSVAWPVAVGGTCGGQWGLRLLQGPAVFGMARGPRANPGRLAGCPLPPAVLACSRSEHPL